MRRLYTYILVLLALGVACQRVDLPDNPQVNQPAELPVGEIGSKATITFSTADVTGPETRGVLNPNVKDPTTNIETLHLIVFDENGMLVEVCEATELGKSDHIDTETGVTHKGGRHYAVTLTVTDKPRIIHYVANCDVDQVIYGHETSVIGNMFVDRNGSDGAETDYEVSYWARIEVPYIFVDKKENDNGTVVVSLVKEIKDKFEHVPLLRNYAEITVTDETDNTFYFEGFTVYNLLNRGTVAPYNSNTQQFQSFTYIDPEKGMTNYSYPQISSKGYEGHALTSAELITDFIRNDKSNSIKIYKSGEPFYVYERKVSVMTDEEEKWRESPPHIIIKGRYDNGNELDLANIESYPIYYYKMDLVYTEGTEGNEEIKYYNILRNFMYQFNLTEVHDVGYTSLDLAVAGAAGNNISGSSSTSKLTNVSDNAGRLWVSYTDITLVTNEDVTFRYKYVPNFYGVEEHQYPQNEVHNELVRFENKIGEVITGFNVADTDITSGEYEGWRKVTIKVNAPDDIIRQQIVSLKTDNVNLNRQIRHTLRKKLKMEVECPPKVYRAINQEVQVDIKLPIGMTEDMFPLELNMETWDRTLSPDAMKNTESTIPVNTGPSIIDIDGRRGQQSYYYTVTIPTIDDYKALPGEGNMKVYSTYWRTNMAYNASTFYVDNKYFKQGSDSWENYLYEFSDVSCSSSAVGEGQNVTISFKMAEGAINKQVTIALEGMTYSGTQDGVTYTNAKSFKYTTQSNDVTISEGLRTTTDLGSVSFTLNANEYNIATGEGSREKYKFKDATFVGVTRFETEANVEADFTFNISTETFEALKDLYPDAEDAGVPMFVTLYGLQPADDKLVYSQIRAEGDRYIYRIKQAGTQTIRLATTNAEAGTCTVTLEADYFDTETVSVVQSSDITYSGENIRVTYNVNRPDVVGGGNAGSSYSAEINSIKVNGAQVDYTGSATYTYSSNPGTLTVILNSISITGGDLEASTVIEFDCTVTRKKGTSSGTRAAKFTKTIGELNLSISN